MVEVKKADFVAWKNDPVTKEVFTALGRVKEAIHDNLTNPNVLLGDQKEIVRLLGQSEGIDIVLNISTDDMEDEEDDDYASWT